MNRTITTIITRRALRGKPLLEECNRAITYRNQVRDNRFIIECQGGIDEMTDEVWEPCRNCGAYFANIDWEVYKKR